jgi:hypothetical protein
MTMKKRFLIALLLLGPTAVLVAPQPSAAQQPKMDIKLFLGVGSTTFVSMLETGRERETSGNYQIGFGPRVRRRKAFIEILFSFNRWIFVENDAESMAKITGRVNSFELPFNMGYIPYKNPLFKLFLYAGYVNHFNTKVLAALEVPGEPKVNIKRRPKEADIAIYQAIARFGANFDVAMFNFDFNYSISLNSARTKSYRTGYHQFQLNLAYLF